MLWKSKRKFTRKLQKEIQTHAATKERSSSSDVGKNHEENERERGRDSEKTSDARLLHLNGPWPWTMAHGPRAPSSDSACHVWKRIYICIYIYAHIRYTMYSTCSVLYYSHMGRSWWVLDFIFSCASSSRIWPPFYLSLGQFYSFGFLNQWSLQKGCAFFPSQDGQVWAGKTQRQKIVACQINCQDTLALRSPRYPMTNIA